MLFELSNGAHGVVHREPGLGWAAKIACHIEIDGSKCALAWDQESPNEMWVGYREKANEILVKDPSLLHEAAREYAHYPGGHPEAYPDGPKNLFRNVYRAVERGEMPESLQIGALLWMDTRRLPSVMRCSRATKNSVGLTLATDHRQVFG